MFNANNGYSLADIAAATGNGRDGVFGGDGNGWWIIILFLFCFAGWGNGGYGFGGFATPAAQTPSVYEGYVLNNDMSMISRQVSDGFNSQERKLDFISNGICSLGYDQLAQINGINTNIMQGTNTLQGAINGVGSQLASCCCDLKYNLGSSAAEISRGVERGFSDTNYNLATQANGITTAVANGFCQTNFNAQTNTRDIVESQNASTAAILARIDALESSRKDEKIAELTAINSDLRLAASQAAQNNYLLSELKPCPQPAYVVPAPFGCNCNHCGC